MAADHQRRSVTKVSVIAPDEISGSVAVDAPHALELRVRVLEGAPVRVRVTHHVALGGDDGSAPGAARRTAWWSR